MWLISPPHGSFHPPMAHFAPPWLISPPHGSFRSPCTARFAARRGTTTAGWTLTTCRWRRQRSTSLLRSPHCCTPSCGVIHTGQTPLLTPHTPHPSPPPSQPTPHTPPPPSHPPPLTPHSSPPTLSLVPSFPRSLGPTVPRSHGPTVPRSHGPMVPRSLGPTVPRSLGPSVPWSHGPSVPRSHGPSVPRSLGPMVPRSLGPTVPRSLGPSVPRSLGSTVPRSHGPSAPRSHGPHMTWHHKMGGGGTASLQSGRCFSNLSLRNTVSKETGMTILIISFPVKKILIHVQLSIDHFV